jgi:hypothetical protein
MPIPHPPPFTSALANNMAVDSNLPFTIVKRENRKEQ